MEIITNMKITKEKRRPRKSTARESTSICSRIGSVNLIGKKPKVVEIFVEYWMILS